MTKPLTDAELADIEALANGTMSHWRDHLLRLVAEVRALRARLECVAGYWSAINQVANASSTNEMREAGYRIANEIRALARGAQAGEGEK